MTDARVFIGVAPQTPGQARVTGVVAPAGARVHLVTDALRAALEDIEEEDLEYEAMWEAAADCPDRVVVAAADVPAPSVILNPGEEHPSAAVVEVEVTAVRLVSWHVAGDDDDADAELSWYDASETAEVARLLER